MRNWEKQVMLIGAVFLVTGCLQGGAPRPKPSLEEEPVLTQSPEASHLQLRLIGPESSDPEVPARAELPPYPGKNEEVTASAQEIVFKSALQLPEPAKGPLFLAWDERALGPAIQNAYYSHRIVDSLNRPRGELSRDSALHDRASRRWFLSLSRLFADRPSDADPSDTQILTLDLQLEDGSRVEYEIRFKAVGPLPPVQNRLVTSAAPGDALAWSRAASKQGWPLVREEFANPSARPVALWVRKAGDDSLELTSNLRASTFEQNGNLPPVGPVVRDYWTTARVHVGLLRVVRTDGAEDLALRPDDDRWVRLVLRPGETLTLEWKLVPGSGVAPCPLPATQPRVFRWTESVVTHRCQRMNREAECLDTYKTVQREQTAMEEWQLDGAELSGVFHREAMVTDPSEVFSAPQDQPRMLTLQKGIGQVSLKTGRGRVAKNAWACMGLF
ncbi:MAG: hypothetical protein NDJ90_08280 [Oligoflexia bacterium]|nr:hypothetical protein [Oligoflexia bacterium]